ncbi:MAG: OHCU decarboxylase [Blastocatellia bacterium]|nr:MAG: OHCU decarboxylase [Blastocatellia bacterium]
MGKPPDVNIWSTCFRLFHMSNNLTWLNKLSSTDATTELLKCCGSRRWAEEVNNRRPFTSLSHLNETAHDVWWSLDRDDWLEAFRSHPKIGERTAKKEPAAQAQQWSTQEQAAIGKSSSQTKDLLAKLNHYYEAKFGYIYIVCATGKSAEEMLLILQDRLSNDPDDELKIAAAEQAKITALRLAKLLVSH